MLAFGHHLRRLRRAGDLTKEDLTVRAGVSARLTSDLKRGTIQRPRRVTSCRARRPRIVGRQHEVAAALALDLATEVQLLTLIDPGGDVKMRLALEIALDSSPRLLAITIHGAAHT